MGTPETGPIRKVECGLIDSSLMQHPIIARKQLGMPNSGYSFFQTPFPGHVPSKFFVAMDMMSRLDHRKKSSRENFSRAVNRLLMVYLQEKKNKNKTGLLTLPHLHQTQRGMMPSWHT